MLGSALAPALVAAGHEIVGTDINLNDPTPWGPDLPTIRHLDVRDRDQVRAVFAQVEPDIVFHLAAETPLEISDAEPDHAYLTNAIGTKYVALNARAADIPMTYISTAGVFDGRRRRRTRSSTPRTRSTPTEHRSTKGS